MRRLENIVREKNRDFFKCKNKRKYFYGLKNILSKTIYSCSEDDKLEGEKI